MSTYQQDLERMLRWYPRRWRDEHAAAFIGIHLDAVAEDGDQHSRKLSRKDKVAIRSAGIFERTRYIVPIVAAAAATIATAAGMILATNGYSTLGPVLWLVVGPALTSTAFWSLRAARDGRWSRGSVVPMLASLAAIAAFASAFWVAVLRDQVGVDVPGLNSLWALGVLAMAFVGVAVATAATPSFIRGGMRRDWAITLSFVAGVAGAVPLAFALLSGVIPLLTGAGLTWWAIRNGQRHGRPVGRPA